MSPSTERSTEHAIQRLTRFLGIQLPIIQAPMAGSQGSALALAVCEAGGLGSLPAAALTSETLRAECPACGRFHEWTVRDAALPEAA